MHYFMLVLIPESTPPEEIENKVEAMMGPFSHHPECTPHKYYPSSEDIAMMVEVYGTDDLLGLATRLPGWDGALQGGVDEQGLYGLTTRNDQAKWDWWRIGGRWDGEIRNNRRQSENGFNFSPEHEHLENNILPVRLIDHKVEAHGILTPDGQWIAVRRGEEDEEWDKRLFKIIQEYRDCYLVGVDVHN